MKKCPFRKTIVTTDYHLHGSGFPMPDVQEEIFCECIGEECMAFHTNQIAQYHSTNYCELTKGEIK